MKLYPPAQGLYDPRHEHDACGVGFICQMKGVASHQLVSDALQMLENMNHRGACGCEENSGDGAGLHVSQPRIHRPAQTGDARRAHSRR